MATKAQLYDHLMKLQVENHLLKAENDLFRSTLHKIHVQTRSALGIEAAAQAREDERQKAKNQPQV